MKLIQTVTGFVIGGKTYRPPQFLQLAEALGCSSADEDIAHQWLYDNIGKEFDCQLPEDKSISLSSIWS